MIFIIFSKTLINTCASLRSYDYRLSSFAKFEKCFFFSVIRTFYYNTLFNYSLISNLLRANLRPFALNIQRVVLSCCIGTVVIVR